MLLNYIYVNTYIQQQTTQITQRFDLLIFSMFTEEDSTTINNEDRKELYIRKNTKIFSIL